jgi:hypothetical protein
MASPPTLYKDISAFGQGEAAFRNRKQGKIGGFVFLFLLAYQPPDLDARVG